MVKGPPQQKRNRRKPWEEPPAPGPTIVVNVDGVVASMEKFKYLIDAPTYKDRDWKQFHREYRRADLIRPGAKLVRYLDENGFVIVWSTTRLDQFATATDNWIRAHQLPVGHLMPRSLFKDGTSRPVDPIKQRQWWRWNDKFGETNPIVAWIDDPDQSSVDALREQGCPAWSFPDLFNEFKAGTLMPALDRGPEPIDVLRERAAANRPEWELHEAEWQEERAEWRARHMQRLRQRQNESRARPPR